MYSAYDCTCLNANHIDVACLRLFILVWHFKAQSIATCLFNALFLHHSEKQFAVVAQGWGNCICFFVIEVADLLASLYVVEQKTTVFQSQHHIALVYKNECLRRLEVLNAVGLFSNQVYDL